MSTRPDGIVAATVSVLVHILFAIAWWPGNGTRGVAAGKAELTESGTEMAVVYFVAVQSAETVQRPAKPSEPILEATASADQSEPIPPTSGRSDSLPSLSPSSKPADTELADDVVNPGSAGDVGGEGAREDDLAARYRAAVRAAVVSHWTRRTGKDLPANCAVRIDQDIGGRVLAVNAGSCSLTESEKLQLEAVVLMAQPLPYEGFETVFVSSLHLTL